MVKEVCFRLELLSVGVRNLPGQPVDIITCECSASFFLNTSMFFFAMSWRTDNHLISCIYALCRIR